MNIDSLGIPVHNGAMHTPEEALKRGRAWSLVRRAIRDGFLTPAPCESCGAERSEAHHDNYDKPLDVRWLCNKCHKKEHTGEAHPHLPSQMTSEELREILGRLGLSQRQAARIVGAHERSMRQWVAQNAKIPMLVAVLFLLFDRIPNALDVAEELALYEGRISGKERL